MKICRQHGLLILCLCSAAVLLFIIFNRGNITIKTYDINNYHIQSDQEDYYTTPNHSLFTIDNVLQKQKAIIEKELANYNLKDLVLADGGRPIRNLVIATWRTGSTFFSEIINALPGNFYHYEPLLYNGYYEIQGADVNSSMRVVKKLFMCDYSDMTDYIEMAKKEIYLFSHNEKLWKQCVLYPEYCFNTTFLSEFCKVFPFQLMKIVRWRLQMAEELLRDDR